MKTPLLTTLLITFISSKLVAEVSGELLFDDTRIIEFHFSFSQPDYWQLLLDTRHTENYVKGDLMIDGAEIKSIGVRLKGQSSWQIPSDKKSIKIDFDEYLDQKFDGLDKLNLNNGFSDPTFLREKLFYEHCNAIGLPAPRTNFAVVYINNIYFGLYTVVEEVEKTFLKERFSNNDGNLYKGDPAGDLAYYGETASDYNNMYSVETNKENHDWTDLITLIKKINLSEDTSFENEVTSAMYVPNFLKYWAALSLFSSYDSYLGSAHNYFLYNDPVSGKFHWIPWDCNESFGGFNYLTITGLNVTTVPLDYLPPAPEVRPLAERCLQNPILKNCYYTEVYEQMQSFCNENYLFPKIDTYANLIREAVYADSLKMYTDSIFELNLDTMVHISNAIGGGNIPGLKELITVRSKFINDYFRSIGFEPTPYAVANEYVSDEENFIHLIFSGNTLYISNLKDRGDLEVYSMDGKNIFRQEIISTCSVDLQMLPSGVFVYTFTDAQQKKYSGKFVKQ